MPLPSALVVDDNYYNRDLIKLALSHVGYEIVEAENGQEALNILGGRSVDLLLLDLAMPEMDGIGVLNELKRQQLRQDMCVIVVTANAHMAIQEVEDEADYIFYKPVDIQSLTFLLKRLTGLS